MERTTSLFELVREQKWSEMASSFKDNEVLDTNIRNKDGNYLITYAVLFNKIDIVSALFNKGARLDVTDKDGRSVLFICIKYGYDKMLNLLLKLSKKSVGIPLTDITDINKSSPLHHAVKSGNFLATVSLLDAGSMPNFTDGERNNALHLSVYSKSQEICKLILERNININAKTQKGETALHISCSLGLEEITKMLLKHKLIDVDIKDDDSELTALGHCVNRDNAAITNALLEAGANVNVQDMYGSTPLHHAVTTDSPEIFELLMSAGGGLKTNVNLRDEELRLPLHLALQSFNIDANRVRRLLPLTNLTSQNADGDSCFHIILKKGLWRKYTNLLRDKKLDLLLPNKHGARPIDYVINNKHNMEDVIDLTADAYLNRIRKKPHVWKNTWENICKFELPLKRYAKISDEGKKEVMKFIKNPEEVEGDLCKAIIVNLIRSEITSEKGKETYPIEALTSRINLMKGDDIEFCTFTGETLDVLLGVIMLMKKHKNVCTTITTEFTDSKEMRKYYAEIEVFIDASNEFINFEVAWIGQKLHLSESFINEFKKCRETPLNKFIIVPMVIELKKGTHANYLIYDARLKEIERFEPQGKEHPYMFDYNQKLLDGELKNTFEIIIGNMKYVGPEDYLPKIGLQKLEISEHSCEKIGDPRGFCALWGVWYADMRIKYYNVSRKKLMREIVCRRERDNISLKNMVRNYSTNITKLRDAVLTSANLNINDWLNSKHSKNQLDKVIEKLREMISSVKRDV